VKLKAALLGVATLLAPAHAQLHSMGSEGLRMSIIASSFAQTYSLLHTNDPQQPDDDQIEKFVNGQLTVAEANFRYNAKSKSVYQISK
jgi:hypothetical protein